MQCTNCGPKVPAGLMAIPCGHGYCTPDCVRRLPSYICRACGTQLQRLETCRGLNAMERARVRRRSCRELGL